MINLVGVTDIAKELSAAAGDNERQKYLQYLVLAKSVLRDLKYSYLNKFKRVYVQVDKNTNIARLPFDYYKYVTLSYIERCIDHAGNVTEKVLPLAHNEYLNITSFKTPEEVCKKECGCSTQNPVCVELENYETIEETVELPDDETGTKTTTILTCANGDITKEVCEPYLVYEDGTQVCNYEVVMEIILDTVCSYSFEFPDVSPPFSISVDLNGDLIESGQMDSATEARLFLEGLGFSHSFGIYTMEATTNVFSDMTVTVDSPPNVILVDMGRVCMEGNVLQYPYNIISYQQNDQTIIINQLIENIDDLDAFFAYIGFDNTTVSNENPTYSREESEYVFGAIEVEGVGNDSPPSSPPFSTYTININQSDCKFPLVNAGIQTKCTTEVLCNVTLKPCGCIEESQENIKKIVECCSGFLNSCQIGIYHNWHGWTGWDTRPTNTPLPYSYRGTYRLDEENYLIYLDNVTADTLLLAYYTDGNCEGEFLVPVEATEAIKAGIYWRSVQYNENISEVAKRGAKANYNRELTDFSKWLNPLRVNELVAALHSKLKL